jgi:hypothetical protein
VTPTGTLADGASIEFLILNTWANVSSPSELKESLLF